MVGIYRGPYRQKSLKVGSARILLDLVLQICLPRFLKHKSSFGKHNILADKVKIHIPASLVAYPAKPLCAIKTSAFLVGLEFDDFLCHKSFITH